MNYCRFSSNDNLCDVYCHYDTFGGYSIHVAAKRVMYCEPLPEPVPFDGDHIQAWMDRNAVVAEIMSRSPREPIGLDYDGESFHVDTAKEAADTLRLLKKTGYNVPDSAIAMLDEEASESMVMGVRHDD